MNGRQAKKRKGEGKKYKGSRFCLYCRQEKKRREKVRKILCRKSKRGGREEA